MERDAEPTARPRLVALRALKLGDLLVAVPALRGLRRGFPAHRIVLAAPAWLEPIVRLIDAVDELLPTPGLEDPLPLEPGRVDVAANLHGNGPESRRRIEELEPRLRIVHRSPEEPDGVPWVDGMHQRVRWARLVSAYGAPADPGDIAIDVPRTPPPVAGAAVIHVGAAQGSRLWPEERFAAVARAMRQDGLPVVFTGGAGERERALRIAGAAGLEERTVLAGVASLGEFAALVADAAVTVTVDTGAAHLASAYGTPSAIVFGPAPPEEWGPPPGPHIVLTDERLRRGDPFSRDPDPALLAVTAEAVVEAARSVRRAGSAGEGRELSR